MADDKRWNAYVWVTWITGLLAGSEVCEWKTWYRAHFRYAKKERGGDLDDWQIQHDGMVRARTSKLEAEGYRVTTEDQNQFKLKGSNGAVLSGKPDIVGVRTVGQDGAATGTESLVVDEKSGDERLSDQWQVLVYMFALPRLFLKSVPLRGEVEYRTKVVEIAPARLDVAARAKIVTTMQTVTGDMEPPRTPSAKECRFCDVLACPDRIESKEHVADVKEW